MPHFLARSRVSHITPEVLSTVVLPAILTLEAKLSPKEVFGPSEVTSPRATFLIGKPTQMTFEPKTGAIGTASDDFLSAVNMKIDWINWKGVTLEFNHDKMKLTLTLEDISNLHFWIDYVVSTLATSLSITMGLFVEVVEVRGTIEGQVEFDNSYWVDTLFIRGIPLDWEARETKIRQAADLQYPWLRSYPRLLCASVYYQHALRFASPHEINSPPVVFLSEVTLNLAKCLETLFGGDRDKFRKKCMTLGYSDEQVESQIIPILVLRNQFDVGHPVASMIDNEEMSVVRDYIYRSIGNVRAILMKVSRHVQIDDGFLKPLSPGSDRDRINLCRKIKAHLQMDPLPQL